MNFISLRQYLAVFAIVLATNPSLAQQAFDKDILAETFGFDENTKRTVELDVLHQARPDRDCIQSIDQPKFVSANDAGHVAGDDIVLALTWKGERRAYPAKIIDHHEIVNDVVADTPIAITWCPLCGSAVGVLREIEGQVTEFGVAGLLYNSDLVFYDRVTQTLWEQVDAVGIVGPLAGVELDLVPITTTRWSTWRAAHPETMVLSPDTGFARDYSKDQYADYRQLERLFMPVSAESELLHPKTVVYGFKLQDAMLAVTETLLEENRHYEHEVDGRVVTISLGDDGSASLIDSRNGESIAPVRLYWFAWYTFHPDTELVK